MYNGSNTVRWDPNVDADLAGYKVYTGSLSHVYDLLRTLTTTGTVQAVTGLDSGQAWYHAVTAYDLSGNESTFSAEVSRVVTNTVLNLLRRVV